MRGSFIACLEITLFLNLYFEEQWERDSFWVVLSCWILCHTEIVVLIIQWHFRFSCVPKHFSQQSFALLVILEEPFRVDMWQLPRGAILMCLCALCLEIMLLSCLECLFPSRPPLRWKIQTLNLSHSSTPYWVIFSLYFSLSVVYIDVEYILAERNKTREKWPLKLSSSPAVITCSSDRVWRGLKEFNGLLDLGTTCQVHIFSNASKKLYLLPFCFPWCHHYIGSLKALCLDYLSLTQMYRQNTKSFHCPNDCKYRRCPISLAICTTSFSNLKVQLHTHGLSCSWGAVCIWMFFCFPSCVKLPYCQQAARRETGALNKLERGYLLWWRKTHHKYLFAHICSCERQEKDNESCVTIATKGKVSPPPPLNVAGSVCLTV